MQAGDARTHKLARRFNESGEALGLYDIDNVYAQARLSPDGGMVAWQENLDVSGPPIAAMWPVVVLADLETGQIILRAVRASMKMGLVDLQWLSDSSGMVVATSAGFAVLRRDGSLQHIGPVEELNGAAPVLVPRQLLPASLSTTVV